MAPAKNGWVIVAIAVLCWAIAASMVSAYYYVQYSDLYTKYRNLYLQYSDLATKLEKSEAVRALINLGIDYANGTRVWYNGTKGLTLYEAMVNAGWRIEGESYGAMGFFVKAINGVEQSVSESKYWGWWSWTDFGWSHGGAACDKYVVSPGETIIWYYSYTDPQTFQMTPPP